MLDIGTSTGIVVLGSLADTVGYITMYRYVLAIMAAFVLFGLLTHRLARQVRQPEEAEE